VGRTCTPQRFCSATPKHRLLDDLHRFKFVGVGVKVITLVAGGATIVRWRTPSTPFLGTSAKPRELLSTSRLSYPSPLTLIVLRRLLHPACTWRVCQQALSNSGS
jgi:hypothetical protein